MINPFLEISERLDSIQREQREIKSLLEGQTAKASKDLLNVSEAAAFLDLAKATLYTKSSKGEIPSKRQAGRLYFSKKELNQWLEEGTKSRFSIENLSNVKGPESESAFMPWPDELFCDAWKAWKEHLNSVHQMAYKTTGEEQKHLNRLESRSNGDQQAAIETLKQAIEAGKSKF